MVQWVLSAATLSMETAWLAHPPGILFMNFIHKTSLHIRAPADSNNGPACPQSHARRWDEDVLVAASTTPGGEFDAEEQGHGSGTEAEDDKMA